jgi:PhnB protein
LTAGALTGNVVHPARATHAVRHGTRREPRRQEDPMKDVMLIPELTLSDARGAIRFYERAFGAKDLGTHATPDNAKIMHSALQINGAVVFVCDDFPERGGPPRSPKALGGSPVTVHLNCADVQQAWQRAVQAGASVVMPLERQFWGDIYGILEDPFGQRWSMSAAQDHPKPDHEDAGYKAGAEKLYPTKQARPKARPAKARPAKASPKTGKSKAGKAKAGKAKARAKQGRSRRS